MARCVLTILILLFSFEAVSSAGNPEFIPNEGQWTGSFVARADLTFGAFFLEENGYSVVFRSPETLEAIFGHLHNGGHGHSIDEQYLFAFRQRLIGSTHPTRKMGADPTEGIFNFLLGKDPSKWKTAIKGYRTYQMDNVYPGIDQVYHHQGQALKYEYQVSPGTDPSVIQWTYEGTSDIQVEKGELIIRTPYGTVTEGKPFAYQIINGHKTEVSCRYHEREGVFSFKLGKYDPSLPLIIDPTLIFATFSGSTADNWGFTATYDLQGNFYGGGVAFGTGYPVTTGAYQTTHKNSNDPSLSYVTDIAITKFNPTGTARLYSTYLGGSEFDLPLSMIVDNAGNLVIYGVTGSADFPTSSGAFQDTLNKGNGHNFNIFHFNEGIDIIVAKLNPSGTNLLASTYVGGSSIDGANKRILYNYGDETRGEVVVDAQDNIYIASNTESVDFPGLPSTATIGGNSDAVIFKLNSSMTNLAWANLFGGSGNETGFSLKIRNGQLWLGGGTTSNNLPGTSTGVVTGFQGLVDGYIARFSSVTGGFQRATYLGTPFYDQAFLIDLDKFGTLYAFGQTGGAYPTTSGVYNVPNSRQFIHRISADLDQTLFAFLFGSGLNKYDLVPSAFEVDDCMKIFVAGWNGRATQSGYPAQGNTKDLPTTPDAIQSTTDEADFYFAVFGAYGDSLLYATYYGGAADEHIDGGTSRFSPDGTIYQGVCGGCSQQSFPTTPGVVGPTNNSPNCNFAGIKIDLETSVSAIPIIDTTRIDTTCGSIIIQFKDLSLNASEI
ncbi:MAG: hypothetical protein LPK47_01385, partial [Bacteroidota bacterium]|nr:hypothetical protein [Bacteroidota bacterium]